MSTLRTIAYSRIGSNILIQMKKRNLVGKKPMEIENGVKIFVDYTNPRGWNLVLGKDTEIKVKQVFLKNITPGNIIIDCGASVGEFSLLAAKEIGSEGLVLSIEPVKENVLQLKENFVLNNFTNYKIIESAVSDKSGITNLYDHGVTGSSCLDSQLMEKPVTKVVKVNVLTVDEIIKSYKLKKVDLLKIDIEGFEYEAFLGCKDSFNNRKIEKIICEVHTELLTKKGINEKKIFQMLESYGFNVDIIDEGKKTKHIFAKLP